MLAFGWCLKGFIGGCPGFQLFDGCGGGLWDVG